jgi:hypothetical protein
LPAGFVYHRPVRSYPDDAFEWIRSGREKFPARADPAWRGVCVSGLIPAKFEAYAKILHGIEATYENIDSPLTERENEILKIPKCEELRSFVERLRAERLGARIRWRTLAELIGVPFQAEICHEWFRATMEEPGCWPRFLLGPGDGNLGPEEFSAVLSLLQPFTGRQDCFFRFAELPFVDTGKPILFRGVLDELRKFLADGKYQFTPEYWWPADGSWCLCSDYDLVFTILGGSKKLISAVLENATLEALEVTQQTRVDDYAPMST